MIVWHGLCVINFPLEKLRHTAYYVVFNEAHTFAAAAAHSFLDVVLLILYNDHNQDSC